MKGLLSAWQFINSYGIAFVCLFVVIALCLHCGFPFRHRNLPPIETVVTTVISTISALAGFRLLTNTANLGVSDVQLLPNILGMVVLWWVGFDGLLRSFRSAKRKRLSLPKKRGS